MPFASSRRRLCRGIAAAVICLAIAPGHVAARETPPEQEPTASPRQLTDDRAKPLAERQPRSAEEFLRLRAVSLFATGRLLERREKLPEALRYYQRAVRHDPRSVPALARVVRLAQVLSRYEVAARYAVMLAERQRDDDLVLLQALIYLSSGDDESQGTALYERTLAERDPPRNEIWFELHKLAGRIYRRQGQPARAAEAFARVRRALSEPDKFGLGDADPLPDEETARALYLLMSDVFRQAKRYDEALAALAEAERKRADKVLASYFRARIRHEAGDSQAGLSELEKYLASGSDEAGGDPYRLLGDIYEKLGRSDEFVTRLQRLARRQPGNAAVQTYLGEEYRRRDRTAEARRQFRRIVDREPTIEAHRGLTAIYREAGDWDELVALLGTFVAATDSLEPLEEELKALLDDAATRQKLYAAARRLEDKSIRSAFGSYLAMGRLALAAREFDVAREFFERIINSDHPERPAVLLAWGFELLMVERYEEAAALLKRGLEQKLFGADKASVHYYLAGALVMVDRFDEAIENARRAVSANPRSPEFRSRLAWVLTRADRRDEARKIYASLIEEFQGSYESGERRELVRESRLSLSQLHALDGDFARGAELLREVLDEYPQNIGAKNDLAYFLAEDDTQLELAEVLSRAAVAAKPDSAAYRDTLGWVFYRQGKFPAAIVELRRAIELSDREDGILLDHLGDALREAGQPVEAVASWKRAYAVLEDAADATRREQIAAKIVKYSKGE
ncbi:MAG: hypothetical protein DWQ31_10085 [Planctomycetota bacterium]|mgnify:CR=1 FL=1|nr:MAG: hypothetical protein DWQ31_10085 [Planctomycetota bacterium]REJ91332.1 MAG: hypothetical protein DWQ35_14330 [Planctomycetota bacterium]REK26496.1 MAG: hypothetical protein DWQ42_08850 [Planctomycetota bacterium]REK39392.1 MAG: hypothetical protein DWQ46_19150 [Planctomycetota bacterium]